MKHDRSKNPFRKSSKYIIAILISLFSLTFAQAQQKTETQYLLKGNGSIEINAFGGPTLTFSTAYKKFALFIGGDAGIIINRVLLIGGYGEWYLSEYEQTIREMVDDNNEFVGDLEVQLKFNHAGFIFGYLYKSEKPIHFGITSRFGWGLLKWEPVGTNNPPNDLQDNVFVITPKFDIGLNLTPWAKMVVGGGYRFVTGINESYPSRRPSSSYISDKGLFDSTALDSFVVDIGFYFGDFK